MRLRCFAPSLRAATFVTAFTAVVLASRADAQDDPTVVRVEEDWELVVKTPDQNSAGPQVVCTISPFNHLLGIHAAVELNHQSLPDFAAGGIQLQAWNGEDSIASNKFPNASVLSHDEETVSWTQTMRLEDDKLIFEVTDGTSQSWGDFGGQGFLKWWIASNLASLDGYSTQVSATNSGVSYGANLVQYLEIKQVRLFMSDGTIVVNNADICVCGVH